jgi:predicted SPOUT superfamily RNA methylase MTH1
MTSSLNGLLWSAMNTSTIMNARMTNTYHCNTNYIALVVFVFEVKEILLLKDPCYLRNTCYLRNHLVF